MSGPPSRPRTAAPDIRWQHRLGLRHPAATLALIVLLAIAILVAAAPLITAPAGDAAATIHLMDGFKPPLSLSEIDMRMYWLGTDQQGQDLLQVMLYSTRRSLLIAAGAIALAAGLGGGVGLIAGYCGGWIDNALMRIADIQLAVPAFMMALVLTAVLRGINGAAPTDAMTPAVLIVVIGLSEWVVFARSVRIMVQTEKSKSYIEAAQAIGASPWRIMLKHLLPQALPTVSILALTGFSFAISAEATLSFLGVGMSPAAPSLGTLIRNGQAFLFSGEWWILLFPAVTLAALSLAFNTLGDHWREGTLRPGEQPT